METGKISSHRFKIPQEAFLHSTKILTKKQLQLCDDIESQLARYEEHFIDAKKKELHEFKEAVENKLGELEEARLKIIEQEIDHLHSVFNKIFDTIEADCIEICHSALKAFWHDTSCCDKISSIVKDILSKRYLSESSTITFPEGYILPEHLAKKLNNIKVRESSEIIGNALKVTLGIGKIDANYDDVYLENLDILKNIEINV